MICGEEEIRTLDTIPHRIYAFQAYLFNHSSTSPKRGEVKKKNMNCNIFVRFCKTDFIFSSKTIKRLLF